VFDDGVNDDVPGRRHGHRVTRRHSGTRFASRTVLVNLCNFVRMRIRFVGLFHFVDPPIRTLAVHQPAQLTKLATFLLLWENKKNIKPFQDLIEPFDDDNSPQNLDSNDPLEGEQERKINGENIFRVEDQRDVDEERFAVRKPVSQK
jgi:hypothetical protein